VLIQWSFVKEIGEGGSLYIPRSEGTREGIISNHKSASAPLGNKARIKGLGSSVRCADNTKNIHTSKYSLSLS